MNKARYIAALVIVIAMPPAVIVWFVVHPFADRWRKVGPASAYCFIAAFVFSGMVLLWLARKSILNVEFGFNAPLSILAVLLLIAAGYMRIQWRRVINPKTIIGVPEIFGRDDSRELVTTGIYSRIRHPRYVEVGLFLSAMALFSNYLGAYIFTLAYAPVIHLVVVLEERELAARFGEAYEEYRSRVPRYVPGSGRRGSRGGMNSSRGG
jgi:protein-S-isoprenylcysteine O-methyltransferase Ste14